MGLPPKYLKALRVTRTVFITLLFTAIVALLMVWLAGGFSPKISADAAAAHTAPAWTGPTAQVRRVVISRTEEAVGNVRAAREMVITSRVPARITELNLTAGQSVARGDLLVRLDARDLTARVEQARAAATAAAATRDQARVDYQRYAEAFARQAVSKTEFDRIDLALKNTESEVLRTAELVNEAQAALEYATITAPSAGIVVDRRANVGDTVMPGQVLATLYDPSQMQLVASVRETLTQRLKIGQPIGVRMDALELTCQGMISEIVPEAQSDSRTFQVKVTGPCPPGIYSGMFGRIVIPLDSQEILVIPAGAIRRVGQLQIVDVVGDGRLQCRIIRPGRNIDGDVEVLSGLVDGESVALHSAATPAEARR